MAAASLHGTLSRIWSRRSAPARLLYPLSLLFRALVAARRALYRAGVFARVRLPVPVVVVGNLSVGGTGKTPLVLWLAQALAARGLRPGIVSRGYGAEVAGARAVDPSDDARAVGDEPLLLARRAGCPVWVGRERVAAARALLAAQPQCDLLIADDGLQHYRMARDVEIAVLDARGFGNGWLLPAGPLREPPSRLREVDALVVNAPPGATPADANGACRRFAMRLVGERFHRLGQPEVACGPEAFAGARVHALAGIGDPRRFFDHLAALGVAFTAHAFSDHHAYRATDLFFEPDAVIVMTEKDAVKCAGFAPGEAWVLPVTATLTPDLADFIVEKLYGFQAA